MRRWRWQIPEKKRSKEDLRRLINNLILVCVFVSVVYFFVLPMMIQPDLMGWLNSSSFLGLAVSLSLLFVAFSLNSGKYEFCIPEKEGKKKTVQVFPPETLRLGVCDVCGEQTLLSELSAFEIDGETINICSKCFEEAKYES